MTTRAQDDAGIVAAADRLCDSYGSEWAEARAALFAAIDAWGEREAKRERVHQERLAALGQKEVIPGEWLPLIEPEPIGEEPEQ